jgi:hypothetical protein
MIYGPKVAVLVTNFENTIVYQKGSTPHFILTGTNPYWVKNLTTFGEIGIVYTKPTKLRNYLENHLRHLILLLQLMNRIPGHASLAFVV